MATSSDTTGAADDDFGIDEGTARSQWQEEAQKLGRFNLAVFGKTGVGKSTLINAIFGAEVARTGIGEPVTQGSHLYVTRSGTLGLYDTRGLEIGTSTAALLDEVRGFVDSRRTADPGEHIHIAYYCVRAGDHRIEPAEEAFIRGVHDLGIPVFLVLTQVHMKGGVIRGEHLQFAQHLFDKGLPVHSGRPYLTAALPDPQLGFEAFGVTDLLEATYSKAPEAAQMALAAAQILDRGLKRRAVKVRVGSAATMAAAVGATPIPFADAALLVPIQTGMMASIAQVYRVPMDSSLAVSLAATGLATNAGRSLVGSLLKLLPGAGSVVGGSVSAAVASGFTVAMGTVWGRVCEMMVDGRFGPLDAMDSSQIKSVFMDQFKDVFAGMLKQILSGKKPTIPDDDV